jgi:hypothetical protein
MTSTTTPTIQGIAAGPGQWDLVMSFFEGKPVSFTLQDGSSLNLTCITSMYNMRNHDSLQLLPNELSSGVRKGYLLAGQVADTEVEQEAYIEYILSPKMSGICTVGTWDELDDLTVNWSLPNLWSDIMGLRNNYTGD